MSKEITTIDTENSRLLLALEECETRIRTACRRTVEATRAIGKELTKIRDQELYKTRGYDSFKKYVQEDLQWDLGSVYRLINIFSTVQLLDAEHLKLPEHESQAAELAKLEPASQIVVWKRVLTLEDQDKQQITVASVRLAVEDEERRIAAKQAKEEAKKKGKGVGVTLDLGGSTGGSEKDVERTNGDAPAPAVASVIALSEKGEAALDRIRAVCGDEVAAAIEQLRIQISERDLIKWAEQDKDLVGNIAWYVVNERWSVNQAIKHEEKKIDGGTTVDVLLTMCRARGGTLRATHDDGKIAVDILPSN